MTILGLFTVFAVIGISGVIFLHTKAGKRWMDNLDK